jgi:hypothetical protein
MKCFTLIMALLSLTLSQKTDKITGRYDYLIAEGDLYVKRDQITFKDSVFVFDNKYMPEGKVSYGENIILLDHFINTDLIISISKDQIQNDTIEFNMHDKRSPVVNYLDVSTGKGMLIRTK